MANNKVLTEFLINGTWVSTVSGTDLSARVRSASPGGGVEITRGVVDQQSGMTAQTSDFTLNNRDGLFNNRNPLSPLYRLIPRYTQVRHSVYPAAGSREGVLDSYFPADGQGRAIYTVDKPSISLTGDLEIRFEITPYSWRPQKPMNIVSKYVTVGSQRSWLVALQQDGSIALRWSPDGTSGSLRQHVMSSSLIVAAGLTENIGRAAIKILFDVDNGAAGVTSTWSWSTSIGGTYTAIGSVVAATTTSFFASTADLEIGNGNVGGTPVTGQTAFVGRFHAFRLYSGLTSTSLVANMDATAQAPNTTTWADTTAAPNTWLRGANPYARITSDQIRFHGELTSLPIEWDTSGRDIYVSTRALGTLGRLMQTGQNVNSPMKRYYLGLPSRTAYWPCEAKSGATRIDTATPGTSTQLVNVTFTGSSPSGLAGSAGTATLVDNTSFMKLYKYGDAATGSMAASITFKLGGLPATAASFFLFGFTGSTLRIFELKVGATTYQLNVYDTSGTVVFTANPGFGTGANPSSNFVTFQVGFQQEGANVRIYTAWGAAGASTVYTDTVGGTAIATQTAGIPTYIGAAATQDAAFAGALVNHFWMGRDAIAIQNQAVSFTNVAGGYDTERSGRRLLRAATEAGTNLDLIGDPDDTPQMGPQPIDTLVNIMQGCAEIDGGVLAEARDQRGFTYTTQLALGDASAFSVAYTDGTIQQPLRPTDDNRYLANDVTVSTTKGTTANYALSTGANSVLDPPNGAGRIAIGITRNTTDTYVDRAAQWEVFWRTWDELRWPNVTVHMNRQKLAGDSIRYKNIYAMDVGSAMLITALPTYASYDSAYLSLFGYTEKLDQMEWRITFNAVARGPYESRLLATGIDTEAPVMDSADSQSLLNTGVNSTATSMDVKVVSGLTSGRRWSVASGNVDAVLAGERLTITAVTAGAASGSDWVQTLTVTRSVNGVVKTQSAGNEFRLYRPDYITAGA